MLPGDKERARHAGGQGNEGEIAVPAGTRTNPRQLVLADEVIE